MYRLKPNFSRMRHWVRDCKLPVSAPVVMVASTALASTAYCEAIAPLQFKEAHAVAPVVEAIVAKVASAPKTLWERVVEGAERTRTKVSNAVRYIKRIMTYFLYGAPLIGLVPASYYLGESLPSVENMTWRYLVWAIQHLGPCFIKLAQWASTRPDLFPPKLIEKIEVLQDDVTVNYTMDTVERTMEKAFGSDWKSRLTLNPKPLGSGSVAQVFQGVLKQAKEEIKVAVKMIHPHVEKLIRTDMELLSIFADYLDTMPQLEILSLGDTCREFAHAMNLQMDLRVEAKHLQVFNKKFKDDDWVVFPKPIEGYVTRNVLVETLMDGAPMKSFLTLANDYSEKATRLKGKLSDLGCRLILKMVFFDNYIHADLHPGNLLVQLLPNGNPRLAVLDCGIVYSSPSEQEHKDLSEICLAFMQHDGMRAGRLMLEKAQRRKLDDFQKAQRGEVDSSTLSARDLNHIRHDEEFCRAIHQIVIDAESESYFEHMSEYFARICDLARKHSVRLDPGYFKIAMALKVAEGISLSLDRNLDLITKCIPIVLKAQAMRKLGLAKFPAPEPDDEILATRAVEDLSDE